MANAPSKDMKDMQPSRTTMTTRSRKVQPELKERAEQFLAKANVPKTSSSQHEFQGASRSRKRKLQDLIRPQKSTSLDESETRGGGMVPKRVLPMPKSTKKPLMVTPSKNPGEKKPISSQPRGVLETGEKRHPSMSESTKRQSKSKSSKESNEKRLKRYRKQAPHSYLQKLHRAQTQRMIVLKRTRSDTEAFPREDIELVGSTGNIYTVTIGQITSCTCPDHQKGNECKHKVYVLHNVLRAPEHLQHQLAFLSSELRDIFAAAPAIPTDVSSAEDTDGKRKSVEGECPICYMDFDEEHNQLVWCKAACGNNMHKSCFDQWAATQRDVGVKCVYCRTPWHDDPGDLEEVKKAGSIGVDGYVNVGKQFGMSQARDYSTYHPFWVRRHLDTGW